MYTEEEKTNKTSQRKYTNESTKKPKLSVYKLIQLR
jgi:hypothetical protein